MIWTIVGWVCGFAILGTFLYANITDRYEPFNWTNVVTAFFLVPINVSRDATFGAFIGLGFAIASVVWLVRHYRQPAIPVENDSGRLLAGSDDYDRWLEDYGRYGQVL